MVGKTHKLIGIQLWKNSNICGKPEQAQNTRFLGILSSHTLFPQDPTH